MTQSTASGSTPAESPGQALAVFGVALVLLVFVFQPLQERNLVWGLVVSQWGGYLMLAWLAARATGQPLAHALRLRRPPGLVLGGAVLIGISAWAVVALLSNWLLPIPQEVEDRLRDTLLPRQGGRTLAMNLFLVAVTPAVCEEALFRGPILRGFTARLSPWAAALLTGTLFGLFHLDVWRILPTGILGVLLSWVALRSGSIVPAMIVHLVSNATLIALAQLGNDDTLADLSARAEVAIFVAALGVVGLGCRLVQRAAPGGPT